MFDQRDADMKKFGLIGNPIAHSKSPALFAAAYHLNSPEHPHFSYGLIEAESCPKAMQLFEEEGYLGINITSPYKELAMGYVHNPDRVSTLLAAANVIIRGEDGRLSSYNTDYYGVYYTMEPFAQEGASALVIGGGGAGKAAALALKDLGFDTALANRTPTKVVEYCGKIGVGCIGLDEIPQHLTKSKVVVYALMMPVAQLSEEMLREKIILEANYAHPNYTTCGSTYIGGREWLINQAIPAFRLFTGEEPDTEAMKKAF